MNVVPTPTRVYRRRGVSAPTTANEIVVDSTTISVVRRRRPVAISPVPSQAPVAVAPSRRVVMTPELIEIPISTKPVPVMSKLPRASAVEITVCRHPIAVQGEQLPRTALTMNWSQPATPSPTKRSSRRDKFTRKVAGLKRQLRELAMGLSDQTLGLTNKFSLAYGIRENLARIWDLWSLESAIAGLKNFAAYEALRQFIALARARQMKFDAVEARVKASLLALV